MPEQKKDGLEEGLMKAKSDALRLLSFQPRSISELKTRLIQKGHSAPVADQVIEGFKKQGLLNDEKFAQLFANSRVDIRKTGKARLQAEMRKKGLSSDVISKTMQGLEGYDEKKMARELAQNRLDRMKSLPTAKKKARLFGFLQRRGYRSDTIYAVLTELLKDSDNSYEG
jgi:regulatory protein